jgi:hypothetical protein
MKEIKKCIIAAIISMLGRKFAALIPWMYGTMV